MKNGTLKVLFIGDIVGRPGRNAVKAVLPKLREDEKIDLVFANCENMAAGSGVTFEKYKEMLLVGIDYFTSGNHIWDNRDIIQHLKDKDVKILRPANYPYDEPGEGTANIKKDNICLSNLLGRVFIPTLVDDPFRTAKDIVESYPDCIHLIDFHAEATSEKVALGFYLDGKISALFGTHTHIQTADERILPKGTAYITDVGMCGPLDSVLGVKTDIIIQSFLTGLPQSHKVAVGDCLFNAVLVSIDPASKKATAIKRINQIVKANPLEGGEKVE